MDAEAPKRYPSDLTDGQRELIELVIPPAKAGGRSREVSMREVINTLLYLNRDGCQRDMLPYDLPPKSTVTYSRTVWSSDFRPKKIMRSRHSVFRLRNQRSM